MPGKYTRPNTPSKAASSSAERSCSGCATASDYSPAPKVEALANSVPDNGGVYFVPAFVGLGAPHWDSYARGSIFGLTRGSNAGHIARAALESIAYQVADLLDAMRLDSGTPLPELRVDGGAAANDSLMQFQADILGVPVVRPAVTETTALGAALSGRSGSRFLEDRISMRKSASKDRRFEPRLPTSKPPTAHPLERSRLPFKELGIRLNRNKVICEIPVTLRGLSRSELSQPADPEHAPLCNCRKCVSGPVSSPHSPDRLLLAQKRQKESIALALRRNAHFDPGLRSLHRIRSPAQSSKVRKENIHVTIRRAGDRSRNACAGLDLYRLPALQAAKELLLRIR